MHLYRVVKGSSKPSRRACVYVFPPDQLDSENDRAARIAERVDALEKRLVVDSDAHAAAAESAASEQRRKFLDRLLRQAALLRDMLAASGRTEAEGGATEGDHEEEECWEKTEGEMEEEGRGGERKEEEGEEEGAVKTGSRRTSRAKSVVESELIGRAHARYVLERLRWSTILTVVKGSHE